MRKRYVQSEADYRRRTEKLFESANIKIDSMMTDLFGVMGRNWMQLLILRPPKSNISTIFVLIRVAPKGKKM
jgi:hypothetical protein